MARAVGLLVRERNAGALVVADLAVAARAEGVGERQAETGDNENVFNLKRETIRG